MTSVVHWHPPTPPPPKKKSSSYFKSKLSLGIREPQLIPKVNTDSPYCDVACLCVSGLIWYLPPAMFVISTNPHYILSAVGFFDSHSVQQFLFYDGGTSRSP